MSRHLMLSGIFVHSDPNRNASMHTLHVLLADYLCELFPLQLQVFTKWHREDELGHIFQAVHARMHKPI